MYNNIYNLAKKYFKIAQTSDISILIKDEVNKIKQILKQNPELNVDSVIDYIYGELLNNDDLDDSDLDELNFLKALNVLSKEQNGHPVFVKDLRNLLNFTKEKFDTIALKLLSEVKVGLHHTDHPFGSSVSDLDRNNWVTDGKTYYPVIYPIKK